MRLQPFLVASLALGSPASAQSVEDALTLWYSADDDTAAVAMLRPFAEAGHGEAAEILGEAYRFGFGIPVDGAEAERFLRIAIDNGMAEPLFRLAEELVDGDPTIPDDPEAALALAADWIDTYPVMALRTRGWLLTFEHAGTDRQAGFEALQQAAALGDASALYLVGNAYEIGAGVDVDIRRATINVAAAILHEPDWGTPYVSLAYYVADLVGDPADDIVGLPLNQFAWNIDSNWAAAHNLAREYGGLQDDDGLSPDPRLVDPAYAVMLCQYVLSEARDPDRHDGSTCAQVEARFGQSADWQEGLTWYQRSWGDPFAGAPEGSFEAAHSLWLSQRDDAQAVELLRPHAEAGHAHAISIMALAHERGWGVDVDADAAIAFYETAVDLGRANAMLNYAEALSDGDPAIPDDPDRAWALANEADHAEPAQQAFRLAHLLSNGVGVSPDPQRAVGLFHESFAGGEPEAAIPLCDLFGPGGAMAEDSAEARLICAVAAAEGDPAAWRRMGLMVANGIGGGADPVMAVPFFVRALAEADDPVAARNLAEILLDPAFEGTPLHLPVEGVALLLHAGETAPAGIPTETLAAARARAAAIVGGWTGL